ncbi:hypothetical protein VM1G_03934 [Cytospora mali]|uniref:F-box domain-containing protein n=1 Tax=Cytospora mali TaxID=578113 RepID=A0A194VYE0_CYTMA|nr:hypothetical protein VM1G_03934 [Valsa mali]
MAPDDAVEAAPSPRALRLTDLPREIQQDIVGHCQQHDLICLSVVSKHFHELAAAELYRNFQIVFPDEDDRDYDTPIDGLAGGLHTFVTSEYNYAKHLRDIELDTVSIGDKAETAYKPYLYSLSCGKFLNTLLYETLRKAKALEALRWNIRVELSRPVYKALHEIETLSHLHIRLQDGPSLYEQPLPLPIASSTTTPNASTNHLPVIDPPPPASAFTIAPSAPVYVAPIGLLPPHSKSHGKAKMSRKSSAAKNPPTLSGFKKLKTLAVLDIDDLDVVTELRSCVRNSQGTLTKLKLSFSHNMAMRARKDSDPDDSESSDPDDEFQVGPVVVPPPAHHFDDASGPARAFRAQEERKTQESVLGRIFDVEPPLAKKPVKRDEEAEAAEEKTETSVNPGQRFIDSIRAVSEKLMKNLNGTEDFTAAQQEVLDTIETAAKKYVREEEGKASVTAAHGTNGEDTASGVNGNNAIKADAAGTSVERGHSESEETQQEGASLFASTSPKGKEPAQDVNPDDIDIEEPGEDIFFEEPEVGSPEQSPSKANGVENEPVNGDVPSDLSLDTAKAIANIETQTYNFGVLAKKLESLETQAGDLHKVLQLDSDPNPHAMKLEDAETRIQDFKNSIRTIIHEMKNIATKIGDAEKQIPATANYDANATLNRISEYIRWTRGLGLQSLSIYLIPVKASVLSRAIDLRVLKRITLLNVGPQAPVWALFAKENKIQPIALRNIFTDNVTTAFLAFVSQLEELHELFMLERTEKYKPESFAPKTNVTKDHIRRLVLKRHMKTLKGFMAKNQRDQTWDVDEKTMLLICRRGRVLEELAVSMGIRAIHTLLQHISGLVNLRALHIINLRNDDTCVWVMRETKRFIIDNLSHYPELKLEWLAIDDDERVERIIRWKESPKGKEKNKSAKSKGKEKAPAPVTNGDQFPVLTLDNLNLGNESEEDEDDNGSGDGIPRIDTTDIHVYEIWDVRIFDREITAGRL